MKCYIFNVRKNVCSVGPQAWRYSYMLSYIFFYQTKIKILKICDVPELPPANSNIGWVLQGPQYWSPDVEECSFPDSSDNTPRMRGPKNGKTTAIRRAAVRETGFSRHHGGPIEPSPLFWNPSYITALSYLRGPSIGSPLCASLSGSGGNFFLFFCLPK